MPIVTRDQALKLLTDEVQGQFGPDELLEVYNEVFPEHPATQGASSMILEQVADHINNGLQIDEIIDLWGLIFPKHRNVWYDEEEERIHYNEEETVPTE